MSKTFDLSRNTAIRWISTKDSFTFDELKNAILNAGGVMSVAPGCTVKQYLDGYENSGVIKYDHITGFYSRIK